MKNNISEMKNKPLSINKLKAFNSIKTFFKH